MEDDPLELGRLTPDELAMFRSLLAKVTGGPLTDHPNMIAAET